MGNNIRNFDEEKAKILILMNDYFSSDQLAEFQKDYTNPINEEPSVKYSINSVGAYNGE